MSKPEPFRTPYVGSGEDGARKSAQIDAAAAEELDGSDPRYEELLASARRWEDQAYVQMLVRLGKHPTLQQVRDTVGNEEWLAALRLIELSPTLTADASRYTSWSRDSGRYTYESVAGSENATFHPDALIDFEEWVNDVDTVGRGWSSTEHRLFKLVAALVVRDRELKLVGVMDAMGSWSDQVWDTLVDWASGGNNKDRLGRLTVAHRR